MGSLLVSVPRSTAGHSQPAWTWKLIHSKLSGKRRFVGSGARLAAARSLTALVCSNSAVRLVCLRVIMAKRGLCGTYGCTLPDKHTGLHRIPNSDAQDPKRRCRRPPAPVTSSPPDTPVLRRGPAAQAKVSNAGGKKPTNANDVSTNSASEAKRPIGLHPCAQHESRVGSAFQADANVALLTDSVMPPPAAPPKCLCGQPAEWARSRWWCAVGEAGCGYEATPPPTQLVSTAASLHGVEHGGWKQVSTMLTPTCACGLQAVWTHHGHWFCVRGLGTGCGFVSAAEPPRPEPQRIEPFEAQASIARGVAALLTAAAYGPLGAYTFTGVADCGRGLFARQTLPKETIVGEYGGPRLHMASLRKGEYALQVPGTRHVRARGQTPSNHCLRAHPVPARTSCLPRSRIRHPSCLPPCSSSMAIGTTPHTAMGRVTSPSIAITRASPTHGWSGVWCQAQARMTCATTSSSSLTSWCPQEQRSALTVRRYAASPALPQLLHTWDHT